jgi:hypothetical protein
MKSTRWIPLSVIFAAACAEGPTAPVAVSQPDVRPYVSGAALANLDGNGHFRLLRPVVEGPHASLSPEQAKEIAKGVIRTWYSNPDVIVLPGSVGPRTSIEEEHGAKINWTGVEPGIREPYFAESHLPPLGVDTSLHTIRHFGPHFLVPFYEGERPVVVVSVAAYATNIVLDALGFVRRISNTEGGNEFRVSGVPLSLDGLTLPPAPEDAVEFAFEQTGARIVDVPVLGVPGNRVVQTGARWRVRLERVVEFERVVNGQSMQASEVYVSAWPSLADAREFGVLPSETDLRLFVAAPAQPATEDIGGIAVPLRPGYAVDLYEVRRRN